jgi:hypothetical protein
MQLDHRTRQRVPQRSRHGCLLLVCWAGFVLTACATPPAPVLALHALPWPAAWSWQPAPVVSVQPAVPVPGAMPMPNPSPRPMPMPMQAPLLAPVAALPKQAAASGQQPPPTNAAFADPVLAQLSADAQRDSPTLAEAWAAWQRGRVITLRVPRCRGSSSSLDRFFGVLAPATDLRGPGAGLGL